MSFKTVLPKIRVVNINFLFLFFFVICTQMMLHFFFFIIQFVLTFIRIRLQPLMTTKTSYCILFLYISSSLSFGMRPDMKSYSIIVQMLVYYWFVNNCIGFGRTRTSKMQAHITFVLL